MKLVWPPAPRHQNKAARTLSTTNSRSTEVSQIHLVELHCFVQFSSNVIRKMQIPECNQSLTPVFQHVPERNKL